LGNRRGANHSLHVSWVSRPSRPGKKSATQEVWWVKNGRFAGKKGGLSQTLLMLKTRQKEIRTAPNPRLNENLQVAHQKNGARKGEAKAPGLPVGEPKAGLRTKRKEALETVTPTASQQQKKKPYTQL